MLFDAGKHTKNLTQRWKWYFVVKIVLLTEENLWIPGWRLIIFKNFDITLFDQWNIRLIFETGCFFKLVPGGFSDLICILKFKLEKMIEI